MKIKKISAMFLAAAAMTLTACTTEDDMQQSEPKGNLVFVASMPEITPDTRTVLNFDENGKIEPFWGQGDKIQINTDKGESSQLFRSDQLSYAKKSTFKTDEWSVDKLNDADALFAYYFSNKEHYYNYNNCDFNLINNLISSDLDPRIDVDYNTIRLISNDPRHNDNYKIHGDILVAKPIDKLHLKNSGDTIPIVFKRLTGVVRLNVVNNSKYQELNGSRLIDEFKINGTPNFTGKLNYRFLNDSCSIDYAIASTISPLIFNDEDVYEVQTKNDKKEYTTPFYFTSLPCTFTKGNELTFTFSTDNGYVIKKKVVFNDVVDIKAGKITTINLMINDADVIDRPIHDYELPAVDGNVITMKADYPGGLTKEVLRDVWSKHDVIKIKGGMNVLSFKAIYDFNCLLSDDIAKGNATQKNYTLDLSDASIKADPNLTASYNSTDITLTEDDIIIFHLIGFYDRSGLKNLILPNSVKQIVPNGVDSAELEKITIGKNTSKLSYNSISLSKELTITFLPSPSTVTEISPDFVILSDPGQNSLIINQAWRDSVSGNTWNGVTWKSVKFCDENGNIVQ